MPGRDVINGDSMATQCHWQEFTWLSCVRWDCWVMVGSIGLLLLGQWNPYTPIERDIVLTSQGKLSIVEYFSKLKTSWDELRVYLVLPNCNYTKEFILSRYVEGERVHQFLMGLDTEQLRTVWSNLLAMEPLPTLSKAYTTLLEEERQQLMMKGVENRVATEALAFQAAVTNKSKQLSRRRCTHFQGVGHERSQCFKIIGYPPN